MAQKPSIPKGTRDFSPQEMERRNYIFDTIKAIYRLHGFKQIETPAMENLSTLMGKYGEEGDKLLFKILNSGDYLSKSNVAALEAKDSNKLTSSISEKGLRYDLTVPFARYVVQHQNEINFPFKRYQIQAVWRADRPQRGRYREFYQCDCDIIGSPSLLNEVELIEIMDGVFNAFGIKVSIKMNNRKILAGLAEAMGFADKMMDITIALDKIDKIGMEKVLEEIKSKGIDGQGLEILKEIALTTDMAFDSKIEAIEKLIGHTEIGALGIAEVKEIMQHLNIPELHNKIEIDLTLARGLNYYTGAIFEVVASDVSMGSICGGGRYDDLTGIFGLKDLSGVGISFGADRIYDVLLELDKFPSSTSKGTQLMIINFGEKEAQHALELARILRKNNISTELFPQAAKMKKQMNYANKNNISFVLMAGEDEIEHKVYTLKNMETGMQEKLDIQSIIEKLK